MNNGGSNLILHCSRRLNYCRHYQKGAKLNNLSRKIQLNLARLENTYLKNDKSIQKKIEEIAAMGYVVDTRIQEKNGVLRLRKILADETISVEFDSRDSNQVQPVLFDIVISSKERKSKSSLVITVLSLPEFKPMCMRLLPENKLVLDQDVFDVGYEPSLNVSMSDKLREAFAVYLTKRNIQEPLAAFVNEYSVHKYKEKRIVNMKNVLDFLQDEKYYN